MYDLQHRQPSSEVTFYFRNTVQYDLRKFPCTGWGYSTVRSAWSVALEGVNEWVAGWFELS